MLEDPQRAVNPFLLSQIPPSFLLRSQDQNNERVNFREKSVITMLEGLQM